MGRIGAIISVTYNSLTFFEITCIGTATHIIAWILAFFIRETKGLEMTDRIDEEQHFTKEEQERQVKKSLARSSKVENSDIKNPFDN